MKTLFIYFLVACVLFADNSLAQADDSNSGSMNTVNRTSAEIVNKFLHIIFVEDNNGKGLSDILANDFVFDDPFTIARGANDFIDKVQMWVKTEKTYRMEKQFADGNTVCSIYSIDVKTPDGKTATFQLSDYVKLHDGKIAKERVYFSDPVKFAKAMGFVDNYLKAYQ